MLKEFVLPEMPKNKHGLAPEEIEHAHKLVANAWKRLNDGKVTRTFTLNPTR